jgi:endonuclease/exonuclease/phosphatase (EEP) superfamily protein YafD
MAFNSVPWRSAKTRQNALRARRAAYEASCAYWQTHAAIVAGEEPRGE